MTSKASPQSATPKNGFSLISDEKLLTLYASMLKCRMLGERMRKFIQLSESTREAMGLEATVVGVAIDLFAEDTVCPAKSDFMASFLRGVALDRIFRDLRLNTAAQDNAEMATNAALAHKTEKNGKIAVAFSPAGSASQDSWREALAFAAAERLPILFVCRDGMQPRDENRMPKTGVEDTAGKAQASGFPAITVDGSDVVAVYRVASEAIAHARMGHGPTLIECSAYRLNSRLEATSRKQPQSKEEHRRETDDPIQNMERYLTGKGLFREAFKAQVVRGFSAELDAAIAASEKIKAAAH